MAKDGEVHRYKVALGVEAASRGNLIELTNDELRVRSTNTAAKLRKVYTLLRAKDEAALKSEAKLSEKTRVEHSFSRMRAASDEIDRSVRSDSILVDNELRRRLSPKAIAAIPGLFPSIYDAATGTPIDVLTLGTTGGSGFSVALCVACG